MSRHWGKVSRNKATGRAFSAPKLFGGEMVSVTSAVVTDVERLLRWPRELTPHRTVAQMITRLTVGRVAEAVRTATKWEPARSTIHQWRRDDRIPDDTLAQLIARTDQIERLGGTAEAAKTLGVSKRTVQRYRSGQTERFRSAAARRKLDWADKVSRAAEAGIDITQPATIHIQADLSIVTPDGKEYEEGYRDMTLSSGSNIRLTSDVNRQLFDACLSRDHALIAVLLENIVTTGYFGTNAPTFIEYGPDQRVRIDAIHRIDIRWPKPADNT